VSFACRLLGHDFEPAEEPREMLDGEVLVQRKECSRCDETVLAGGFNIK
jgi:hypothetical protein